jgi:hypothetical protein
MNNQTECTLGKHGFYIVDKQYFGSTVVVYMVCTGCGEPRVVELKPPSKKN